MIPWLLNWIIFWIESAASTSYELASLHARVASIKFTKRYGVSEWVSDKHSQWSDSGPIKILFCLEKINKDEEDFYDKCKTFEYPFQWNHLVFFSYLVKPGITLVMSKDLGSSQIKILVSVDDKILKENPLECANQLFL